MSSFRAASGLRVVCKTGRGPAKFIPSPTRVPAVVTTLVRTKQRRDKCLLVAGETGVPVGRISPLLLPKKGDRKEEKNPGTLRSVMWDRLLLITWSLQAANLKFPSFSWPVFLKRLLRTLPASTADFHEEV